MASIYATVLQVKERLGVPASDERSDDALLGIIEAVSRLIDAECNTQFYAATETSVTRRGFCDELLTDDILSVSSLIDRQRVVTARTRRPGRQPITCWRPTTPRRAVSPGRTGASSAHGVAAIAFLRVCRGASS